MPEGLMLYVKLTEAFKLGIVLMNRGEVRGALAEFERANALQPDMPETLVELGKATAAGGGVPTVVRRTHQQGGGHGAIAIPRGGRPRQRLCPPYAMTS